MQTHRRRNRRRGNTVVHASVETVENRSLLTGVVNMALAANGSLILTGDAADNQIEIGLNTADEGFVSGFGGTQIDFGGVLAASHVFPLINSLGPTLDGNLQIAMGQGDDVVTFSTTDIGGFIEGVSIGGNLNVNLGAGADLFYYQGGHTNPVEIDGFDFQYPSSTIYGAAQIKGGNGAFGDYIQLDQVLIHGKMKVQSGASGGGLDQVVLQGVGAIQAVALKGGSGETEIQVMNSVFDNDLSLTGGGQDDQLFVSSSLVGGNTSVNSGSSSNGLPGDYIGIGSSRFVGNLKIDGGAGTTTVQFQPTALGEELEVLGSTTINTRGGSDSILIDDAEPATFVGNFVAKTGGGSDTFDIESGTQFEGNLTINLGGGADTLDFAAAGVTVNGNGKIQGGGGFDTLIDHLFVNWGSDPLIGSIEDFLP